MSPETFAPWQERLDRVFVPDGKFIEPLSERWRHARRGRLTASKRAEIIYNRRPAEWNALMDELDRELHPDYQWEELDNAFLRWGRDHEKQALANITLDTGHDITDPGLLFHPKYPFVAGTPDGLIHPGRRQRITIQIKCPYYSRNHLETLYTKAIRPTYYFQVHWEAWVSKADAIEFYSFDPRQPLATRLVRLPIPISAEVLDRLQTNALEFAEMYSAGRRLAIGKTTAMGVVMPYGG